MSSKEIVSGCGNCNSFTGVCELMFENLDGETPTQAEVSLINPPGAIEGFPSIGEEGLVCKSRLNPQLQTTCSHFKIRTAEDDLVDGNI